MRRVLFALAVLCGTVAPALAQFIPNPPVNGLLYNAGGFAPIGTLPALTANQLLGALSSGPPGGISVPSCFTSSNALIWTPGTGFGCNTISGGGGTVTTTGSPANGNLTQFSSASSITNGNLSGDVTTSGGLATTIGSIGGKAVSFGGAFTMSGAFGFTGTVTGSTTVTFPTSGTLLTTTGSGASLTGILWSQIGSTPTTLAGYGITSPLPVAQGGTAASSASGTALDNITGFASTGLLARTGAGTYSFTAPGTGVVTALGINVGTAGAFVTNGGALGTPSSGTATNLTGTAAGLTAGTVTTNANLTGPITSTGNATAIASQTGTGTTFVMSASPTFTGTVGGPGTHPLSLLATQAANTVVGALTAVSPSALAVPSCSAAGNALNWTSGTGFGCATGYLTANQTITLSGDTTGSGTTAISTSTTKIGGVSASLGGAFTMSGAFTFTGTVTANTAVTFPTSGTLLTTTGSGASLTGITYSQLPALAANQVLGALTATTPSGLSVPSCSGASNALIWTSGTGFGCNTISAGTGNVSTTGSPANGNLTKFSGAATITNGDLTGDVTTSGTLSTTVASIGGKAVSLAASLTTSGANALTLTTTGVTSVTLPTSGTLLTTTGSGAGLTGLVYTALPALSANQLLGALTATTPSGQSLPSCSAAGNALNWTSGTGFGCATGYLTSAGAVTTFSAGTTGLTPNSATSGAITLAGTLTATNGGTGLNTSASTGVAQVSAGTWSVSTTLPSSLSIPSPTFTGTVAGPGTHPLSVLATQAANTVVGALTAVSPSALAVPSCSAAGNALNWTSGTGFGCATGYLTANQTITLSGDTTGSGTTTITTATNSIGGKAVSLGGSFTMSGAFTFAGTLTAATAVTFPISGTLLTTTGSGASLTGITYSQLPALAANQLLGALTATTPSGQTVPSCSAAGNALNWTSGTGFGCATGYLTSAGAVTTFSAGTTGLTPNSATSGAITLAGTLAAANGGTGQTTVATAFASFFQSVATTLGDTIYGGASGTPTRLAGVTATQPGILSSTGTGAAAQAPAWISSTGSGNVVLATSPTITTPVLSGTVTGTYTLGGTPSIAASALTGTALPASIVSSSLTSVGTIATGVWQGTAVAAGFGGTGISTSASTGVAQVSAGTWSVSTTLQSGLTIPSPVFSGTVTGTYTLGGTPSIAGTALTGTNLSTSIITSSLAAVGTISTGVWNGTAVGAQWGGTGIATNASTGIPSISSGTWSVSTTPTFTGTNISGTAASLTAGAANAINSASTTVNVNAAAAPTFGKVLTATSGTTATWQTPNAGGNYPLANLYNAFATINSQIVRLVNLGDSILTCNEQPPCGYGPIRIGSTFALYLIDELSQRFQQYSTGYRAIVRLSNGTTTVSAADGYVLTSGSLTNSTLLGPQESGVSLNGGSLLTLSNAGVITITVGQPYSSVNIACVQGSAINGYTVTINGSAVGSACNSQSGAATATIQNFANPVAFASQPATGSTLTLTALGATNYLYAYEGVLFCTAANTACTTGFAIDNLGVGGASSPWFASGTKTGTTDGGMVWVKAFAGQLAGCVLSNGENDANAGSAVTSTQQNAQNQIVATDCLAKNASVIFMVPPPYNSGGAPATYAALQQGSLTYCQSQAWSCLNMADIFVGDQTGTTSSAFSFSAQDTGAGLTPPWSVAQGLITNSDSQHLNDCGELLVTQQFISMAFAWGISFPVSQACNQNPAKSAISSAYTNATTGFTIVQGATANTGQLEFVAPVNQGFSGTCTGYMQVGTTGVVSFELVGSAAVSSINLTLRYQTAANSVYSFASATAINTGINTSSITAASNLQWVLDINGVNSTTVNSFAVEAHEASGTMTIPAGASCVTQLNGPQ